MDALRLDPLLLDEWALDPWELATAAGATATLAQTLGDVTLAATANDPVSATESTTLDAIGLASTATAPKADASLSQTLGAVSVAGVATDPASAALSQALGAVGLSSTAAAPEQASLTATLGEVGLSAVATDPVSASLSASLDAVGLSGTATAPASDNASLDATLGPVGVSAQATVSAKVVPTYGLTGTLASSIGAANCSPAIPAGYAVGDILLLVAEYAATTNNVSLSLATAGDFVLLGEAKSVSSVSGLTVWWARATSTSMTAPVIAGSASVDHIGAVIVTVSGCAASGNPWDSFAVQNLAGSAGTAVTAAALGSTSVNDCLVMDIVSRGNDSAAANFSGWTNADLSSLTERFDSGTTDGNGGGFAINTGSKATSGTLAQTTATSAGSIRWAAVSIAFKPTTFTASLSQTLDAVGLSASAQVPVQATEASTLGSIGFAGTAVAPATGTLAATLDAIGVSSTATNPVSAEASPTLGQVGLAATATDPLVAQASNTLGDVVGQGTAKVLLRASETSTLGDVSLTATSTVSDVAPPITQEPYDVLRPDSGVRHAVRRTGPRLVARRQGVATTSAQRRGATTLSAPRPGGEAVMACRLGEALLNLVRPSRSKNKPPLTRHPREVQLAKTLGSFTVSATGSLQPMGNAALAQTLASLDLTADGSVVAGPGPLDAALALALDGITFDATGSVTSPLDAQLAQALGSVSLDAKALSEALAARDASLSRRLGGLSVSGSGTVQQRAVLSGALSSLTLAASSGSGRAHGSTALNVRTYGALGDGSHNDTAAFNNAIKAFPASGGVLTVPAGAYLIDATNGIQLRSKVRVELDPDAILKVIPNALEAYQVFYVLSVTDVEIVGGQIWGDRDLHTYTNYKTPDSPSTHEHGNGVMVRGSQRVTVRDIFIKDCTGDAVCLGALGSSNPIYTDDVIIANCHLTHCRRQGISVGNANNVRIVGCEIDNIIGTSPQAGIDIEPDRRAIDTATNIVIEDCHIHHNHGCGIQAYRRTYSVGITGNTVEFNNVGVGLFTSFNGSVTGNLIQHNDLGGLRFVDGCDNWNAVGNIFWNNHTDSFGVKAGDGTTTNTVQVTGQSSKTSPHVTVDNGGTAPNTNITIGTNRYGG